MAVIIWIGCPFPKRRVPLPRAKYYWKKMKIQATGGMNGPAALDSEINKLVYIVGLQIQKLDGKEVG